MLDRNLVYLNRLSIMCDFRFDRSLIRIVFSCSLPYQIRRKFLILDHPATAKYYGTENKFYPSLPYNKISFFLLLIGLNIFILSFFLPCS